MPAAGTLSPTRQKGVIFLTVLVDVIGFGVVIPILPYYAESFGAGPTTVTLLFASFSFFSFLSGPFLGGLSDRIGRRPVLLVSILSTAVGWFVVASASTLWVVFLGRIIDGIAAGNLTTAQAYLVDISRDEKDRTSNLGLFGATFGMGFILGPILGGILSTISPNAPFFLAAGLSVLNVALAFWLIPETLTTRRTDPIEFNPLKPILLAATTPGIRRDMLTWMCFALSFVLTQAVFALFAQDAFQFTGAQTGLVFTLIGVVAVVNQSLLLKRFWTRHFTHEQLQAYMPLVLAIGLLSMATDVVWIFIAGIVLLGVGQGVFRVVLTSIVAGKTPPHKKGEVIGVISGVFSASSVIAPLVGGPLYEIDHHYPFVAGAILMGAAFVVSLRAGKSPDTSTNTPQ